MTQQNNNKAMTNEHNFNVGDIVRLKPKDQLPDWLKNSSGQIAVVAAYFPDEDRYSMKFGKEYHSMKGEYFELCPEDIYFAQRRTAFLTELQALLRKYDARIYDEDEYKVIIDLGIHCNKGERIECMGTDGEINADNIMDFDKD